MDIREEFEKLDEIAIVLEHCRYSETKNIYFSYYFNTMFVNGAWYAFQEQQKKIDEFVSIVHEAYMSDGNSSVEIVYDKIQELLK